MAAVSAIPGVKTIEEQPIRSAIGPDSTVLIVGGSRGIGLEFVRQCASRGARVIATIRGAPKGLLAQLMATNSAVSTVKLEVGDAESARAAATQIADSDASKFTHVIHNAGILGRWERLGEIRAEEMMEAYRVNAVGVVNVVQAFLPLVAPPVGRKVPVWAVLSSRVGSVDENTGGGYAYGASKSACNHICKGLSVDLAGRLAMVLLHPGYVRTDMTGGSGNIDVDESVSGMLRAVEATDAGVGFRWVDYKRELIPW